MRSILVLSLIVFFIPEISQATTVGTLITRLRERLNQTDSTNSNWTNIRLRDNLWQSARDVALLTENNEIDTTIKLTAKYRDYTLPNSWYGVRAVSYIVAGEVNYLARTDPDRLGASKDSLGNPIKYSHPVEFAWFKNKIKVFPTQPNFPYDSLVISGYQMPASLDSNSQVMSLPEYTDQFVIERALFLCQSPDMSIPDQTSWLQWFNGWIARTVFMQVKPKLPVVTQGAIQ